jgi:hypothetical protein
MKVTLRGIERCVQPDEKGVPDTVSARRGGGFWSKQKQILRFLESDGLHRSPEIGPFLPRRNRDDIVGTFLNSLSN